MKATRTQINDLIEESVVLSEPELRIVSGGLSSTVGCYSLAVRPTTNKATGNDWDSDSDSPILEL
jgi:hypothetical protein